MQFTQHLRSISSLSLTRRHLLPVGEMLLVPLLAGCEAATTTTPQGDAVSLIGRTPTPMPPTNVVYQSEPEPWFEREPNPSLRLSQRKSRGTYRELTVEVIAGIPDNQLDWAILDYLYLSLPQGHDDWLLAQRDLTPGFSAIFQTSGFEGQVNNGGISQFFFNSTGIFAYEALAGFRYMGANQVAEIMEEAIALEKKKGTPGSQFRDTGSPAVDSDFYDYADYEELDSRFYEVADHLSAYRNRYIRYHPEEFVAPLIP